VTARDVTRIRPRMGTLLAVTFRVDAGQGVAAEPEVFGLAFDIARRAERVLSAHDPTSALSDVNRRAGHDAVVSRTLATTMRAARRLA
jgi:thiamine biosynthesis lipoprotein ApbE